VKRQTDASGELSGFLDQGTDFHGELTFADTLRIDGKFEGSIRDGKHLIVGETADVQADIDVFRITVRGRLRGNVKARERVELHASARCECNLDTQILVVAEGAHFQGSCTMQTGTAKSRDIVSVAPIDKLKKFATSD
jgi:cytoskeletal protein CcmA (bactofilin family)